MHPLRYRLLADENIHEEVVLFLRRRDINISSVREANLHGSTDEQLVGIATSEQRIVLTHDADFGRILFTTQPQNLGVIYLRPGHLDYTITIQTLQSVLEIELDSLPPFILVIERTGDNIKLRLRQL